MKAQPNRLAVDKRHQLGGTSIDRSTPLRFQLDGRPVHGFKGDTVLSALIASGIDIVGDHGGHPIALGARCAPAIAFAALANDGQRALPMDRTPAIDGADFRMLSPGLAGSRASRLLSRLRRPAGSLGLDLDRPRALSRPWLDNPAEETLTSDVVIVGGGVAGLSAAIAAAHAGRSVILLEAGPVPGGLARLFGTLEGEETPEHSIARLTAEIAATNAITVITRAEAFAIRPGVVRAHVVTTDSGTAFGQVVDYRATAIVLAPGTVERRPLFAGNRLPGVYGIAETFERACRYGIWPGKTALFATVSSPAYRLAMLASDAGVGIGKIIDARPHPQSRFIEFCKAYGITQSPGMVPAHAEWLGSSQGLKTALHPALDGVSYMDEPAPVTADALIACGGWQPELSLWHMAGGQSRWNGQHCRLEPHGEVPGVALAGSAAGYLSKQACLQSGDDAVRKLLGEHRSSVVEHLIDPIYETPDGPTPVSGPAAFAQPAAYLDDGSSLISRPSLPRQDWRRFLPFAAAAPSSSLADQAQTLSVCDVAASVQLGAIPPASAGLVAQERTPFPGDLVEAAREAQVPDHRGEPPMLLPPFLAGRFGPNPALWTIMPTEPRHLDVGALIYVNSDQTDPRQAMGVIVRAEGAVAIGLIGKIGATAGEGATLRDQGRPISVRLGAPYFPIT
jgi:sarcosine oxidase, subunit alpha